MLGDDRAQQHDLHDTANAHPGASTDPTGPG